MGFYCLIHFYKRATRMGNAQARKRIKASDFDYLAKNTNFLTLEVAEGYFSKISERSPGGLMDKADFVEIFHIAFPSRPEDRVNKLSEQLANTQGKIAMSTMLVLFYLFCDGKTEDNLSQMFNMFDMDGNKVITIDELLNMMSAFIEIGEGKDHKVNYLV